MFWQKVLTAGSGRYSHLGFTVDSVNDKDFDINFGKFVGDSTQIGKLQVLNARNSHIDYFFKNLLHLAHYNIQEILLRK